MMMVVVGTRQRMRRSEVENGYNVNKIKYHDVDDDDDDYWDWTSREPTDSRENKSQEL